MPLPDVCADSPECMCLSEALELGDFVGLDVCLAVMEVMQAGLGDSKYRPAPLLRTYVEAGWLGRKSGKGFYDYGVTPPKPTR